MGLRDRHLVGAGAAACAVSCPAPTLGVLGIAGAAATVGTFVFAGLTFAIVVGLISLGVFVQRRRAANAATCRTGDPVGPVDVELSPTSRR